MVYGVYAFRDNKTSFGQIWNDYNDDSAKRGFAMMMVNSNGLLGFAPQDFDLFKIGEFDSETGQLDPVWPIQYLVGGNAAFMEGVKLSNAKPESESVESD